MLREGGEEGARTRVEKWLNPEGGAMSWLVSCADLKHDAADEAVGSYTDYRAIFGEYISIIVKR
jgi:hypothetical protein